LPCGTVSVDDSTKRASEAAIAYEDTGLHDLKEKAEAERFLARSGALPRELVMPVQLAGVLLEHAEWVHANGRVDGGVPLVAEALAIFHRLEAGPWIEPAERLGKGATVCPRWR
jgi:hypothetical protein